MEFGLEVTKALFIGGKIDVLILVLMEFGLEVIHNFLLILLKQSLNPCFNGIWS